MAKQKSMGFPALKNGPPLNSSGLSGKADELGRKGILNGGLMDTNNLVGGGKMFDDSSESDSESSNSSVGSQDDLGANSLNKQGFPYTPNLGGSKYMN